MKLNSLDGDEKVLFQQTKLKELKTKSNKISLLQAKVKSECWEIYETKSVFTVSLLNLCVCN